MKSNNILLIIVVGLFMLLAPYIGLSVATGNYTPAYILMGLVLFGTFAKHGKMSFAILVATIGSGLILPLPGRPYLWEAAALLGYSGIAAGIIFGNFQKGFLNRLRRHKFLLLAGFGYAVLLVISMRVHGVGLNVFGSGTTGGRAYVQQIILVVMLVIPLLFAPSERAIVKLTIINLLLATTYLVSDFFYNYWNALSPVVLQFFELSVDTANFANFFESGGFRRWQSLSKVGVGFLMLLLVLFPLRSFLSMKSLFLIPIVIGLLAMTALGGHRSAMLEIAVVVIVVAFAQKMTDFRYILSGAIVGIVILSTVYLSAKHMPIAAQRSVSFLPGIDISRVARDSGDDTMSVRATLFDRAVELIQKQGIAGRGFGIDMDEVYRANEAHNTVEKHVALGRFYSGIISTWVTLGIFGVIIFGGFVVVALLLGFRMLMTLRRNGEIDIFACATAVFCGRFLSALFQFCFFSGNASTAMLALIPYLAVLLACEVNLNKRRIAKRELEANVPSTPKKVIGGRMPMRATAMRT